MIARFHSQTNRLFYQIIGIAVLALFGLGLIIFQLSPFFLAAVRGFSHQLSAFCGCANHWNFSTHPFIFSATLSGGVFILGWAGYVFFKVARVILRTRVFIRLAVKNQRTDWSKKLIKVARQTGLAGQIVEIQKEEPTVFCFGFWRPKICLSHSLIKRLNSAELAAVLLHEKQHLLTHEPRKAMLIKILSYLLFFIPGFQELTVKYVTYSELSADERATANFRNKVPLAQALCKIIKWKELGTVKEYLALSFFGEATEERINKLVDNDYKPKIKIFTGQSIIKLFFLTIGLAILLFLPRLTSAQLETSACLEMPLTTGAAETQCHWPTVTVNNCSIINQYTSTHSFCSQ